MFAAYYIIVALITFWAVSTHRSTRSKPFVAIVSAAIMPFTLPLIPVIGLLFLAYKKLTNGDSRDNTKQEAPRQQRSMLDEIDQFSSQLLSNKEKSYSKSFVDSYVAFMDSTGASGREKRARNPAWVSDKEELEAFTSYVVEESSRQGVAKTYAMMMFLSRETLNMILGCISSAEAQGYNFNQQKEIGVEFIKRGWINLDDESKDKARNISLDADAIEMLSDMD